MPQGPKIKKVQFYIMYKKPLHLQSDYSQKHSTSSTMSMKTAHTSTTKGKPDTLDMPEAQLNTPANKKARPNDKNLPPSSAARSSGMDKRHRPAPTAKVSPGGRQPPKGSHNSNHDLLQKLKALEGQ
jgi:hypothetical protein